jgi:hypothetical protein
MEQRVIGISLRDNMVFTSVGIVLMNRVAKVTKEDDAITVSMVDK